MTDFGRITAQHFAERLAVPVAEHGGRAALHVLLEIGLVAAEGQGCGRQGEALAPEKIL